jgi:hypothetical protein
MNRHSHIIIHRQTVHLYSDNFTVELSKYNFTVFSIKVSAWFTFQIKCNTDDNFSIKSLFFYLSAYEW